MPSPCHALRTDSCRRSHGTESSDVSQTPGLYHSVFPENGPDGQPQQPSRTLVSPPTALACRAGFPATRSSITSISSQVPRSLMTRTRASLGWQLSQGVSGADPIPPALTRQVLWPGPLPALGLATYCSSAQLVSSLQSIQGQEQSRMPRRR